VNDFLEACHKYGGDNEYNPNKLMPTSSTVSYSINNGDDKPMMIMLVGNITIDMCKEIEEKLKALFITKLYRIKRYLYVFNVRTSNY
jgi:hypothetical protein